MLLSSAVCEQLQVGACARRFVIYDPEFTQLTFLLFKVSFPGVQLFVKSCSRNCLFYSVSNYANDNPARLGTELIASRFYWPGPPSARGLDCFLTENSQAAQI
jgi:hypothetical protein